MTQSFPPRSLVLYADDDPDDIELVTEAFNEHAKNVDLLTFNDGIELLDFIRSADTFEHPPCLFILDINMPRLNGKDTLKRLRSLDGFNDVPIVLFSTSTMPADANFAKNLNAGFVTKPLFSEQINQIIDQFIAHCSDEVKRHIQKRKS